MRTWNFPLAMVILGSLLLLDGCNACYNRPSNPEQVREATANATAEIKNDTKAVAEGVRDGLRSPSGDHLLDLNTASKGQLSGLPGISDDTAARIAANRPYHSAHDLVDRRLVTREEYEKIADRITVK